MDNTANLGPAEPYKKISELESENARLRAELAAEERRIAVMAKEIADLRSRPDALRADKVEAERDTLRSELDAVRHALKPFARVAEYDIGNDECDDDIFKPMTKHNVAPVLRVGNFRDALTALGEE